MLGGSDIGEHQLVLQISSEHASVQLWERVPWGGSDQRTGHDCGGDPGEAGVLVGEEEEGEVVFGVGDLLVDDQPSRRAHSSQPTGQVSSSGGTLSRDSHQVSQRQLVAKWGAPASTR